MNINLSGILRSMRGIDKSIFSILKNYLDPTVENLERLIRIASQCVLTEFVIGYDAGRSFDTRSPCNTGGSLEDGGLYLLAGQVTMGRYQFCAGHVAELERSCDAPAERYQAIEDGALNDLLDSLEPAMGEKGREQSALRREVDRLLGKRRPFRLVLRETDRLELALYVE